MNRYFLTIIALAGIALTAEAGPLATGFSAAQQVDPLIQGAAADKDATQASADAAGVAYMPRLNYSKAQLANESSSRKTTQITQPLFDPSKFATLLTSGPKSQLADSSYLTSEQNLATRYFKAAGDAMRAEESLRLNVARIDALAQQFKAAKRMLELGAGTISDVREAQLQLEQAQAANLTVIAQRDAALRQVQAITGKKPAPGELQLSTSVGHASLPPREVAIDTILDKNPQLDSTRSNQRLAEIEAIRAKGALLPTVEAGYTRSEINNVNNNYSQVIVSFPLDLGNFFQVSTAGGNAVSKRYQTLDAELKARLDGERAYEMILAGEEELAMRKNAIRTAELNVEANEKSFRGGVRSMTDVLNAIQAMFSAKLDFVNPKLTYADNLLTFRLLMAVPPGEAMQELDGLLF